MREKIKKYNMMENASNKYYTTEAEIKITVNKTFSWLICEFEKNTYIMPLCINSEAAAQVLNEKELTQITKKYFYSKGYKSISFVMPPVKYSDGDTEISYMADFIQSTI